MKTILVSVLLAASTGFAGAAFADMAIPMPGVGASVAGPAAHGQAQANSGTVEKSDLMGRKVIDAKGALVGQVKDVVTDGQGQPVNIIIATGKKDVTLPASEMKLASNATLKTDKEIGKLAPAPAHSRTE